MKNYLNYRSAVLITILTSFLNGQNIPVFPGAEGFGTTTPAGRGGRIIKVTNLNADGPGSFYNAVMADGPRIVVFEVGGVIDCPRTIQIENSHMTIAGQTAPSPGITLIGGTLRFGARNMLIQHIKIRPGDRHEGPEPDKRSCVRLRAYAEEIVLDHCSFSWAVDENVTIYSRAAGNITVSNCIIAECLDRSIHPEGGHSKGMIVGYTAQNITITRNLFAHNGDRNPLIKGGCPTIILNNFIYNPIGVAVDIGEANQPNGWGPAIVSIVGNVLRAGPGTYLNPGGSFLYVHVDRDESRLYMHDNVSDGRFDLCAQKVFEPGVIVNSPEDACWTTTLNTLPSSGTIDFVLSNCGARPQDRDEIDARVVNNAVNRTGKMINSQNEVGGFPQHAQTTRTLDLPADPHGDDDGDGYTNIEELLHEMASELEVPVQVAIKKDRKSQYHTLNRSFTSNLKTSSKYFTLNGKAIHYNQSTYRKGVILILTDKHSPYVEKRIFVD